MKHCVTCKHWLPPGQRNDFRTAVRFDDDTWSDEVNDGQGGYVRGDEADKMFGECQQVQMGDALGPGEPPLAVVRDGSDYLAILYTQADFGCALWESR